MTKIIIAGAAGRMGRMILAMAHHRDDCRIVGGFEKKGSPAVGRDAGELAGIGNIGIPIVDDPAALLDDGGIMIDFTSPQSSVQHVELCGDAGVGMVIGTTGCDEGQKERIRKAASRVPIVFSPNMSIGVNLVFKTIGEVARILGDTYDIEIVESHHRLKKDAPSGTAARMLEILSEARELDPDACGIYGRHGLVGERSPGEIGVHAVRAGDIVGDHTVLFAGAGERIEITHRAHSRETFAQGALRAALWADGKEPGLYDMSDVLGIK